MGSRNRGFTIIEILIVVVVIGILAMICYTSYYGIKEKTYYTRALAEFKVMRAAAERYYLDHDEYPADVARDLPPGLEAYVSDSEGRDWPHAPWPGSVYDWDAYENHGVQTYQISIRFCKQNGSECHFPRADWAKDFDRHSSLYYCIYGNCKAHPQMPDDHPGYCVNCKQPH